MRYLLSMLVVALCFVLTGCFDITEEITVQKDGSGDYLMTMDMSEMFSNPFMEQAIAEEIQKEGSDMEDMEIDSTATFADMDMPDDLTSEEKALLSRITMHMNISKENERLIIKMMYPFDSFAQMEEINAVISRMEANSEAAEARGDEYNNPFGMLGGFNSFDSSKSRYVLENKSLQRLVIPTTTDDEEEEGDEMDEEAMEMVKMMFGDVTFRSVYHLPGKVKKTTFKNAEIDGKTVTVEYNIVEMMENEADLGGTIKFK